MTIVNPPAADPVVEDPPVADPSAVNPPVEDPAPTPKPGLSPEELQSELERVRQEAAGRRVEMKPFKEAFEGWDPDARDEFLSIAKELANPKTQPKVAKRLQEIAQKIFDAQDPETITPVGDPDPRKAPLTLEEYERREQERENQRQQAEGIAAVEREAEALGFAPLVDDGRGGFQPNPDYLMLLHFAGDPDIAGDLNKAKEKFDEWQNSVVERHSKALQEKAGRWPGGPTIASTPAVDPEGGPPKTYKEARKGLHAWLNARPGQ